MASEIEIETEKSQKTEEKDTGSNHVVPVMLTYPVEPYLIQQNLCA